MAQARFAGGGSDPERITKRAELAAGLKTVKGSRSYSQLTAAAQKLLALADSGRDPRGWTPELLVKGTVSGWFEGRTLPGRNKLLTFLAVCGVPTDQWRAWLNAVARVRITVPGPAIADYDPIRQLGVHQAIHVGAPDSDLAALTAYVVRDHDEELREALRIGRANQLLVLTGGSSVGKTRACYEAVAEVLPGWPVTHPATAKELLSLLECGVAPGTVLWLNETQRYLQPPDGQNVAIALQRLLDQPAGTGRVVVLGSMWLNPYWQNFTQPPGPGRPDEHPHVRDLLTKSSQRVDVAEDFQHLTDDQHTKLHHLAEQDPRLAAAITAGGTAARLTQILAGGPRMLKHYADLQIPRPVAHAVFTAAMDARRIGYDSPLPPALLELAAPGYLTPAQRAAPTGWLDAALADATQEIHGIRALTPVRTDGTIGEPDAFVLHDYLAQHTLKWRRRLPIPASLWEAVTTYVRDPADLTQLEVQADYRALTICHLRLLRAQARLGELNAADRLDMALAARGDGDALAELAERAEASEGEAKNWLALARGERDDAALAPLRARANALDEKAEDWLHRILGERTTDEVLPELRRRFYTGDMKAGDRLVTFLAELDDDALDEMRATMDHLLLGLVLAKRGDEDAVTELRARARSGDWWASRRLADVLVKRGDEEAMDELRARAESGDEYADGCLTMVMASRGDDDAMAKLRARDTEDGFESSSRGPGQSCR